MTDRLRSLAGWWRSSLAVLAGAAAATGFAPTSWWPVLLLMVAAFTLLTLTAPRVRTAALTGLAYGLGFYLVGVRWLSVTFVEALLGVATVEAVFLALLGAAIRGIRGWRGWPLLAAGCWLGVEYLFSHVPFGGFPWLRLGYVTIDTPLAGLLPLVGVPGAGFAFALVAQFVAWAALRQDGWRPKIVALAAAGGVLLSGLAGWLVPAGAESGLVEIGYVQGNAPGGSIYGLGEPRTITRNQASETIRLADRVNSGQLPKPDFVAWPENGTDLDPRHDSQTDQAVRAAVEAVGVPVLLGVLSDGPGSFERQTTSVVWYPGTGPGARYDKRNLVPFGEWVPLRGLVEPLFPVVGYVGPQSVPGNGPGILGVSLPGGRVQVGVLICWELAYDSTVHDVVTGGGEVIVVQSSNAMYVGTGQVEQQFAITRARAAELRRDILVVTTTGRSGLIRADGSVAFTLPEGQPASGVVSLPRRAGVTPAAWLSTWLELAGVAGTGLALGATLVRHIVGQPRGGLPTVRQNGTSEPIQESK